MITQPICGTLKCPLGPIAKPNPSCPIRTPGVDDDTIPYDRMHERCARANVAIAAHHDPKPNHGTSRYGCSGTDKSFPANDGFDDNSLVNLGGGMDERPDRVVPLAAALLRRASM